MENDNNERLKYKVLEKEILDLTLALYLDFKNRLEDLDSRVKNDHDFYSARGLFYALYADFREQLRELGFQIELDLMSDI